MDTPPEYLAGETPEFLAMADLVIHISCSTGSSRSRGGATVGGTQAAQQAVTLPAHSQVLGRASRAVSGLLASFSGPPSGAACSPAQPMDISTFFQDDSLSAALLFLSCVYAPEPAEARLAAALGQHGDGKGSGSGASCAAGVDVVVGMLRLAHRLDVPRLVRTTLTWIQQHGRTVYAPNPGSWLGLAEELQLEELRGGVLAWAARELAAGPGRAAAVLQALDFAKLPADVGAMLLDGLASSLQPGSQPPSQEDFAGWAGAGSLCCAAVRREEAAAAEERARAAAEAAALVEQQFADDLAAQQEQAAEDWDAAFDDAEADADADTDADADAEAGPWPGAMEEEEEELEAGQEAEEAPQWGGASLGGLFPGLAAQHEWSHRVADEPAWREDPQHAVMIGEGAAVHEAEATVSTAGMEAAEPQNAGAVQGAALAGPEAGAAEVSARGEPARASGAGAGEQGMGPAGSPGAQPLHPQAGAAGAEQGP